jgi:hypothetical protein
MPQYIVLYIIYSWLFKEQWFTYIQTQSNVKVICVLECIELVSFSCSLIVALSALLSTPEDGCSIFLRYVGKVLPDYTDAHPKKIRQERMKRGIRLPSETKLYVNVAPRSKQSLCLVPGGFHHAASLRLLTLHWIITSSDIYWKGRTPLKMKCGNRVVLHQ